MGVLDDWLNALPAEHGRFIRPYLDRARELVPEAEQGMSYAMPALKHRGRGLIAIMPTRAGYSAYPFSGVVVALLVAEHPGLEHTKGSIHFTRERPLPMDVLERMVLAARDDVDRRLG